jgi:hypothetical protein
MPFVHIPVVNVADAHIPFIGSLNYAGSVSVNLLIKDRFLVLRKLAGRFKLIGRRVSHGND